MALNIKNPEVERLAIEIAEKTGESRTEAVRRALLERKARLELQVVRRDRLGEVRSFLEREIWPNVPEGQRAPGKSEREAILGYGPDGV